MRIIGYIQRRLLDLFIKPLNRMAVSSFKQSFVVWEFRLFGDGEKFDVRWGEWSRIYEYEFMLNTIDSLGEGKPTVHNTCWGFHGCHVDFKLELESRFGEVLNSDLRHSDLPGTTILDVTKTPPPELKSRFDFVINVSTLEEVHSSQIKVLDNLLTMAKPGGYVLITFDLPGLQLESFEALFGKTIEVPETPISGATSAIADERWGDLRFGFMVIQKS